MGIIMNIGGWRTAAMFRRYAITSTQEIADNLDKLAAYRDSQERAGGEGAAEVKP